MTQIQTRLFLQSFASDGPNSPQEVKSRNVDQHAAALAEKGYMVGFTYTQQDVIVADGREFKADKTTDKTTYYFGRPATPDDLAKLPDWQRENVESNFKHAQPGSSLGVRRNGSLFEVGPNDKLIAIEHLASIVRDPSATDALRI